MDVVLAPCDQYILSPYVYPETWAEDDLLRQTLSLSVIVLAGAYFLYLGFASLSYVFLFDKSLRKHPKFLPDQEWLEIKASCSAMPVMTLLTLPLFLLEVRGYSRMYDSVEERGWGYLALSCLAYLAFNDMCIYWIHRALHHKSLYGPIHKTHHKWLVPTPFASHAFHPVDGCMQALPYHIFVFVVPMHKLMYLLLFVLVNFWTISIHDANYQVPSCMQWLVNGSAHHTDHHLYFNYNYGQYFTIWDRIGGSFMLPSAWQGKGPHDHKQVIAARLAAEKLKGA
mmetsp:Transcript_17354/g.19428  ORF Transcript_17354/g.19428 Transcript_17354/m.19428 type:complete len:283 (-) Transcript_17354:103-951(-)|eukprot:CAMPEP_0205822472 /NCGR_PEP_ID=MMETSP0206-20130828/12619_1 /ASSEMBLY_ACC=CAM_ASM_000279 /TAXON_ID=36767 /ORGANISM="Euplotes focardii, Strain TN1" /LENGTH=282 /DNA_ID=CAMNT_0053118767 /DNA_START=30 /DNA_END=878 /DNA_ORIENTATION=+